MSIQLPNLDDRTYDDLLQEALSLIPAYAPEWTNHNPSDPGITLIELFAYLTEMLNYRLNRVTNANKQTFLKLISENKNSLVDEKGEPKLLDEEELNKEIRKAVVNLRKAHRAITCKDFEELALAFNQTTDKKSLQNVARVRCLPRRNLESPNSRTDAIDSERPGHVSVIIVPDKAPQSNSQLQPTDELLKEVFNYLEPKRLLTTRLHVVGPRYLTIGIRVTLVLKPGAKEIKVEDLNDNLETQEDKKDSVLPLVIKALREFFSPLKGGTDGKGWAFGRNVYVSEIYELLDKQPGVDYIEKVQQEDEIVVKDKQRELRADGQLSAVEVKANELINFQIQKRDIQIPKDGGRITIFPAESLVAVTGG